MNNSIYFYSVPYVLGDYEQPYFKSVEARDNYFNNLNGVLINEIGVNLNLMFNYQFEVKAAIDVIQMDKYNFAVLTYNGKKYYCDILDYEHMSVNRTRVRLQRNSIYEVIDFLSYFNDFLIERDDTLYTNYLKNSPNVSVYKGRYYPSLYEPAPSYFKNNQGVNVNWLNCYIIFASGFDTTYSKDAPTSLTRLLVQFNAGRDIPVQLNGAYKNYFCFIVQGGLDIDKLIDAFSPYTISIHYMRFPYVNGTPFVDISDDVMFYYPDKAAGTGVSGFFGSVISASNSENTYFEYNIPFTSDECFNKLNLFGFSLSNKLELDYKDFVSNENGNGTISIKCNILLSQTCIYLRLYYYTLSNDAPIGNNNKANVSIFPLITNFDYTKDASAKWASENKYYEALTNNTINQRSDKGQVQALENLTVGFTQMMLGSNILGSANVIRGGFEIANTVIDNEYYAKERELLEQQAKAQPDTFISANDSISFFNNTYFNILFYKLVPFESDFNRYKNDLIKYGTNVSKYSKKLDVTKDFIFKGSAYVENEILTNKQYDQLIKELKDGHKYKFFGE